MTTKEIKTAIRMKKSEIRSKTTKLASSSDLEEVRSLGEILDKLRNELDELEEKLDEAETDNTDAGNDDQQSDTTPPQSEPQRCAFNPAMARSLGSFKMATSEQRTGNALDPLDGVALRSGETFLARTNRKERLDLGKFVRGAITGVWDGAEPERRSMTSSTGGVVIPQVLSAEVLDTARNVSFFTSAGCPIVELPHGNLTIARVKKDPKFKFYDELAAATESNMELDGVELKAKTARGFCYVSRELVESAQNLHGVLVNAFAGAIAEMIDSAGLYGQYDSTGASFDMAAPSGIMNDVGISVISATNTYYTDYIKAIGAVRRKNGVPDTIGYNAAGEEALNLVCDANSRPIPMPQAIDDMNKIVTNSFKEDSETGSDAIVMDKNAVIVGIQNNIRVRMTDQSDYCIQHNAVCFDVIAMIDVAVVRPDHICKITGILPTKYQ